MQAAIASHATRFKPLMAFGDPESWPEMCVGVLSLGQTIGNFIANTTIIGGVETIGDSIVDGVESLFGGGDSAVPAAAGGPPPSGPSALPSSHASFYVAPPPIDSSLVGSPEYAALPPNVAVGPVTILSMGGDPELVAAELQKLPMSALNTLAANGTVFAAVPNSVADYDQSLSGVAARGRSGTWDTIPGAYLPDQNVVVIATSGLYNGNQGAYDLVLHETGHAYDAALGTVQHSPGGLASNSVAFQQAYKGTVGTYNLNNQWEAYFTPHSNPTGYLSEAFAESFADTFGGPQSTIANVFTHVGTPVLANPTRQGLTDYWNSMP